MSLVKILKVEFFIVHPEDIEEKITTHYCNLIEDRVMNKTVFFSKNSKK